MKYMSKLVVIDCKEGRFMGYFFKPQIDNNSNYYVSSLSLKPQKLTECSDINWIAPIEWIKP